jgi:hypothetical protein
MFRPSRNTTPDSGQSSSYNFFISNNERNGRDGVKGYELARKQRGFFLLPSVRKGGLRVVFFLCYTVVFEANTRNPVHEFLFTTKHFNLNPHEKDWDIQPVDKRKAYRILFRS